ncbi:hypothetical protein [Paraburkholderia kururiensis]|uniref:Uncharacterized protein n=1 Tax=Paraburkholderia kururiensis TaxID=984307 RepID=A0ABZ0WV18_9BURK|nr:hypothetical protein [Paraburkholderia kururiensis]WQD81248.1 hypothetical protein U0042_04875 [Paraburkholderia kururiensis]
MNLVFDDTASVCLVGNQLVGRLKRDVVDVAFERSHQVGSSFDNAGPTQVVTNLVNDVVGDDVEEVSSIDKVTERLSHQTEVRIRSFVEGVFRFLHSRLPAPFRMLLTG